ncbi:hypothetical protein HPP92_012179 [Vanilla planifolia]|nr:hypothetical protein HPP92_012172 [Vanilla planifolia]KAG0484095.1 hypothetical protein HPP92_012179 [Vanilla planifolia]
MPYPNMQPDAVLPGLPRFPPPPPPLDMRPQLSVSGLPNRPPPPPPPGIAAPPMSRPSFATPPGPPFVATPGPPPFLRPPLPPGLLVPVEDDLSSLKPPLLQKPSYIKSAASTVVKRPLAQHTPELTAMVPASVRVRRETAVPKPKPKQLLSGSSTPRPISTGAALTSKPDASISAGPKVQSVDDSYMAFLEDMKALGALDG